MTSVSIIGGSGYGGGELLRLLLALRVATCFHSYYYKLPL